MSAYNSVWTEICLVFVFVSIAAFFYIKKLRDDIMEDVEHFTEYLEAINKKNYDAHLQIQHYTEFLKMALVFKNLVKRLGAKKKK
jgi:nitrate/nitrite-specific signal transduction histidine kinase